MKTYRGEIAKKGLITLVAAALFVVPIHIAQATDYTNGYGIDLSGLSVQLLNKTTQAVIASGKTVSVDQTNDPNQGDMVQFNGIRVENISNVAKACSSFSINANIIFDGSGKDQIITGDGITRTISLQNIGPGGSVLIPAGNFTYTPQYIDGVQQTLEEQAAVAGGSGLKLEVNAYASDCSNGQVSKLDVTTATDAVTWSSIAATMPLLTNGQSLLPYPAGYYVSFCPLITGSSCQLGTRTGTVKQITPNGKVAESILVKPKQQYGIFLAPSPDFLLTAQVCTVGVNSYQLYTVDCHAGLPDFVPDISHATLTAQYADGSMKSVQAGSALNYDSSITSVTLAGVVVKNIGQGSFSGTLPFTVTPFEQNNKTKYGALSGSYTGTIPTGAQVTLPAVILKINELNMIGSVFLKGANTVSLTLLLNPAKTITESVYINDTATLSPVLTDMTRIQKVKKFLSNIPQSFFFAAVSLFFLF